MQISYTSYGSGIGKLAHKMILKNNKTTKSQTGQYINWKDGRQKEATM